MVQACVAQVAPVADELAVRFYERMFELDPSSRALFSEDPAVQRVKFVAELRELVESISDFDVFVHRTRELGARHRQYGASYSHYRTSGVALLDALAHVLGDAFAPELRDAWRLAHDMVAESMMQGAADAATPSLRRRPTDE